MRKYVKNVEESLRLRYKIQIEFEHVQLKIGLVREYDKFSNLFFSETKRLAKRIFLRDFF